MNRSRRFRAVVLSLALLALLSGIPIVLTWRAVRQERLNHALIAAVRSNDTFAVRHLLHQGADPNAPILPEDTRSLWQRLLDILRHKPAPRPLIHDSALFEAIDYAPDAAYENFFDNVDTANALVEAGADVNICNEAGRTPLIEAASLDKKSTLQMLLTHHVDVNAVDINGTTALMFAAYHHEPETVEILLNRGANVNATYNDGGTALYLALAIAIPVVGLSPDAQTVKSVRETVACLLRHGASVQDRKGAAYSILSLARFYHDKQLIQMLQQAGAK